MPLTRLGKKLKKQTYSWTTNLAVVSTLAGAGLLVIVAIFIVSQI
jgi:hypothetical protein